MQKFQVRYIYREIYVCADSEQTAFMRHVNEQ